MKQLGNVVFFEEDLVLGIGNNLFKLRKLDPSEVRNVRKSKIPSIILRIEDEMFLAVVSTETKVLVSEQPKCAICRHCTRGCPKVRDRFPGHADNVKNEKRIEKYNFIRFGFETINVKETMFMVKKCSMFSPDLKRKKLPFEKRQEMLIGIAQYINENIEKIEDVEELIQKNKT